MNIKLHEDMTEEEKIEVVKNVPRIIVAMLNMGIVLSEQVQIFSCAGTLAHNNTFCYGWGRYKRKCKKRTLHQVESVK